MENVQSKKVDAGVGDPAQSPVTLIGDENLDQLVVEGIAVAEQRNMWLEKLRQALLGGKDQDALRLAALICGVEHEWVLKNGGEGHE